MKAFLKSHAVNRVLGVVFVMMLVGAVYLTYALFTKQFTDYRVVTMKADKAGLQLPQRADVKLRGKFVGELLDVEGDGQGATLTLGLYAEEADLVPADVSGALLPKTLFGEKFVDLQIPEGGGADESIQAGAVITQVRLPEEIEDVLSSLYPLLRTVEPAQINFTLNALATALEGRGDDLGEGLVTANAYLKRLNPELPAAIEDIRLLGGTADVYASIAPQLGTILANSVITLGTVEERETQLRQTLRQTAAVSGTLQTFLEDNGDNLVALSNLGRRQTRVLAKYAPVFPCFNASIVRFFEDYSGNWRDNTLHINLEVLPNQPRGYTPGDQAVFADKRGPLDPTRCQQAKNGVFGQDNLPPPPLTPDIDDGVGATGKGNASRAVPTWADEAYAPADRRPILDTPSPSDLDSLLGSTVSVAQEVS